MGQGEQFAAVRSSPRADADLRGSAPPARSLRQRGAWPAPTPIRPVPKGPLQDATLPPEWPRVRVPIGSTDDESPATPNQDRRIVADVLAVLTGSPGMHVADLRVDANEQEVVLEGEVATQELRERAARMARTVRGARSVQNHLVVWGPQDPKSS